MYALLVDLWRKITVTESMPSKKDRLLAPGDVRVQAGSKNPSLEKGLKLSAVGDHIGALQIFDAVVQSDPESALAYRLAGVEAIAIGDFEVSRDYFSLALHYEPGSEEATLGLARSCREMGQVDRAQTLLKTLLVEVPECTDAWFNLACLQHESGEFQLAIDSLRHGLKYSPTSAPLLNFLGLVLAREFGALEEGQVCIRRALEHAPDFIAAMSNLGWILAEQGKLEEAIAYFDKVLGINPDDQETRLMRAHAYLKHGNFAAGWADYSSRHASPLAVKAEFSLPEFPLHVSPAGKRLLIYGEQGLGDQIMFASCLPDFLAAGGQCALKCDAKLETLLRRSFPECLVLPSDCEVVPSMLSLQGEILEGQLAMGSLPALFRGKAGDFPSHAGYLRADPEKVLAWRRRLIETGVGPYVGVSWQGGGRTTRRQLRSIPLALWQPILTQRGQFFSLQYGECEEDLRQAHEAGLKIRHWPDAIVNYDETAALVAALDLVITVCTAIVHLSGGLGKEVWVLTPATPEWRYMAAGDRMPWYPTAKLFRQEAPVSWTGVIQAAALELDKRLSN